MHHWTIKTSENFEFEKKNEDFGSYEKFEGVFQNFYIFSLKKILFIGCLVLETCFAEWNTCESVDCSDLEDDHHKIYMEECQSNDAPCHE